MAVADANALSCVLSSVLCTACVMLRSIAHPSGMAKLAQLCVRVSLLSSVEYKT